VKRLTILFILLFTIAANAQKVKIGYVNSQQILQQYSEAIKAQSDLDGIVKKWNTHIDSLTTQLQNRYAQFQQQSGAMTPQKQEEEQQALVQLDQLINKFRQEKFGQPNGEYFSKEEELLAPVKQKILKAIKKVAHSEKMNFVFDKSGDVLLLYADDTYDITFKVLDALKRGKF